MTTQAKAHPCPDSTHPAIQTAWRLQESTVVPYISPGPPCYVSVLSLGADGPGSRACPGRGAQVGRLMHIRIGQENASIQHVLPTVSITQPAPQWRHKPLHCITQAPCLICSSSSSTTTTLPDLLLLFSLHRDIKPENCLVGLDGRGELTLKICDFGLALITEGQGPVKSCLAGRAGYGHGTHTLILPYTKRTVHRSGPAEGGRGMASPSAKGRPTALHG